MIKRTIFILLIGNIFAQFKAVKILHEKTPYIYTLVYMEIIQQPGILIEDGTYANS